MTGQGLVDNLLEQSKPFNPVFHHGEMVTLIEPAGEPGAPQFRLTTDAGTRFECRSILIAAGGGSFQAQEAADHGHRGL